ncbi:AKP8L protein, partial [Origma solitaria]|nr:AKP8L protein [Origma solitaria]
PNDFPNDYPNDFPADPEADSADFRREQQFHGRARENFGSRGPNWGRERPRGVWNEPRGFFGNSRRGIPSLFSQNLLPEPGGFAGTRGGFGGNFRGMKPRMRRAWKVWDADFRLQRKKLRRDSVGKKRKQQSSCDEPESKAAKTDGSENSDSDNGRE